MNKIAIMQSLLKGWSQSRSVWDNFLTLAGTIILYLLYNRLSIFDVFDWLEQLTKNEWSDAILYFLLWLICVAAGKKLPGLKDERVKGEEESEEAPILLTDLVSDELHDSNDSGRLHGTR